MAAESLTFPCTVHATAVPFSSCVSCEKLGAVWSCCGVGEVDVGEVADEDNLVF
jgi:hypothetical protein